MESYELKIRCSALGAIMPERDHITKKQLERLAELQAKAQFKITEKQSIELGDLLKKQDAALHDISISAGAQTYIKSLFLKYQVGFEEEIITDELLKGNLCEQDSMALVQQVLGGEFRVKYRQRLENDYLTGCPDILLQDCVEDIKTSWNVKTWYAAEITKGYEYQGRGYMALTGKDKFRLIYCLVDTPESIITDQKKRLYYKFDCDESNEDYVRLSMQIEKNLKPSLIPLDILPMEKRIKIFEITRDIEIENKIYEQVKKCRAYYNTLTF